MRWALLFCGLLLLVGCTRTASPGSQPSPAVLPITNPAPPTAAAPPSRPSIEDQPFRTPTFDQKYDWKLEPGELKFLETNRRTKHQLTLVLKATPVGSKVGVVVVDKTDLDATLEALKAGNEPKNTLAYHAGGDHIELNAAMPAVLPYVIIVRNRSAEIVTVNLAMKAQ